MEAHPVSTLGNTPGNVFCVGGSKEYVPDQKPRAANHWVYITRWHVDAAVGGKNDVRDFNSIYADPITGKREFDTFVIGSMAARSDTGVAPQLSYDQVIRISAQLQVRQGKP